MKSLNIITIIILMLQFSSCQKNLKSDNTTTDDITFSDNNLTPDQIVANYLTMPTGGNFNIGNGLLGGSIHDNSYVLINDRKFLPLGCVTGGCTYQLPKLSSSDEMLFFENASRQSTINFKLFSGNKKIIDYTLHNYQPITLTIDNKNYPLNQTSQRIVMHWNSNSFNKLGMALQISRKDKTVSLNIPDTGEYDITDYCKENGTDEISIHLSRGAILLNKGSDGLTYKIANVYSASDLVHVY